MSSPKLKNSFYKKFKCQSCGDPLTHPPIKVPISPTFVDPKTKDIQDADLVQRYAVRECCWKCTMSLIAPFKDENPEHPEEGEWYRAWLKGELEPSKNPTKEGT